MGYGVCGGLEYVEDDELPNDIKEKERTETEQSVVETSSCTDIVPHDPRWRIRKEYVC